MAHRAPTRRSPSPSGAPGTYQVACHPVEISDTDVFDWPGPGGRPRSGRSPGRAGALDRGVPPMTATRRGGLLLRDEAARARGQRTHVSVRPAAHPPSWRCRSSRARFPARSRLGGGGMAQLEGTPSRGGRALQALVRDSCGRCSAQMVDTWELGRPADARPRWRGRRGAALPEHDVRGNGRVSSLAPRRAGGRTLMTASARVPVPVYGHYPRRAAGADRPGQGLYRPEPSR
jgi:hypothetical protein